MADEQRRQELKRWETLTTIGLIVFLLGTTGLTVGISIDSIFVGAIGALLIVVALAIAVIRHR
jgi:hypothetical protein